MNKKFLPLITGMISAFIIAIFANIILALTDNFINQFFVFYIIPAGALLMSYLCAKGVNIGIEKSDDFPNEKRIVIFSIISSLTCLVLTYLISYFTAYVSYEYGINHAFHGEHISNFIYTVNNKRFGLITYMEYLMREREVSFYFAGSTATFQMNKTTLTSDFYWYRFAVEVVAFVFSWLFAVRKLEGTPHCSDCNKVLKQKNLEILASDDETEIEDLYKKYSTEIITVDDEKEVKVPRIGGKGFKKVNISYCPTCHKGYFQIRTYISEYYIIRERKIKKQEIEVNEDNMKRLLNI